MVWYAMKAMMNNGVVSGVSWSMMDVDADVDGGGGGPLLTPLSNANVILLSN